ncbi:MAG: type II secretion system protein [Candidatus Paceibacterota bacterium]
MICTNKKHGFTLIEMMISLFIMSLAVVFATFVVGAIKTTRDSTFENIAFHIADSKLDEIRAAGYDALPGDGAFTDPELAILPQGAASMSSSTWNGGTKEVMAGVSWRGADGTLRFVTLTTLITRLGGL